MGINETVLRAFRAAGDRIASARILRKIGRLLWDAGKREQGRGALCRSRSSARGCRCADRAGASVAGTRAAGVSNRRQCPGRKMGGRQRSTARAPCRRGQDAEIVRDAALVTAEALNTKGVALARLGRNSEAVREVERSVEVAEAAGLPGAACRGYTNLSVLYTTINPAGAIEVCRRGLEVARRIGDLGFQARLLANLAVACCTFTDRCSQEGVPAAEKAIEIDRALDQREHLSVPLIVLGSDLPVQRRAPTCGWSVRGSTRGRTRDRRAAASLSVL